MPCHAAGALPANGPRCAQLPKRASWHRQGCGKAGVIHTEGNYYFPAIFFMTLFLFISRQKGARQETEELEGAVDTH